VGDRLTAEPGTLEFLRQLLEIAQESDHPMDRALTRVLSKQIGEAETVRPFDRAQGRRGSPQAVRSSPQAEGSDMGRLDNTHYAP
jgi:hypothetical protein